MYLLFKTPLSAGSHLVIQTASQSVIKPSNQLAASKEASWQTGNPASQPATQSLRGWGEKSKNAASKEERRGRGGEQSKKHTPKQNKSHYCKT